MSNERTVRATKGKKVPKMIPKAELVRLLHEEKNQLSNDLQELQIDLVKVRPLVSKNTLEDLEESLKDIQEQITHIDESIANTASLPDPVDIKTVKDLLGE